MQRFAHWVGDGRQLDPLQLLRGGAQDLNLNKLHRKLKLFEIKNKTSLTDVKPHPTATAFMF